MSADTAASQGEQGAEQGTDTAEPETRECRLCEIAPAVLGLVAAGVIVFVSLDLLKGGALTLWALRLLGKGAPADDDDTAD